MGSLDLPAIVAHRGASRSAPENTLAAFRRAHEEGARWVEFDVKLARDGEPVVIHDETLERTTTGRGRVAETPLAALRTFDAGAWFGPGFAGERIPLLDEVLDLLAELGMGFNLEIKPCPGREAETAAAAVRAVEARWPAAAPLPVLSSFKAESLRAARRAGPDLPLGYLAATLPEDWLAQVRALGCRAVHPGHRSLTAGQVRAAKAAGLPILTWTVNEPERARQLRGWGVDCLITDTPAALAAAL